MNEFEMIEKLVEKMNVSFEEASEALKNANGDLIDAIVFLERKAKEEETLAAEAEKAAAEAMADTVETSQEKAGTDNETAEEAKDMNANRGGEEETMKEEIRNTNRNNTGAGIKGFFRRAKEFLANNSLSVSRNGEEKIRIPAWLLAIILVFHLHLCAIAVIISLFLGCRYTFVGKDEMGRANEFMDKAGDVADRIKEQFS